MQAQDEFSLGLNHLPRWLAIVIVVLAVTCGVFILPPLSNLRFVSSLPHSVPITLGVLLSIAALILAAYATRAILQHLRRRERLYAALDAWRLLNYAGMIYYLEGLFFQTLPATGVVFVGSMVCYLLTGLGLPIISNWYAHQHANGTAA